MIITRQSLTTLTTGYKASFQQGFAGVAPMWERIATRVPSATAAEEYAWLGILPNLLVVHPNLKFRADELLKAQLKQGSGSNIMAGLARSARCRLWQEFDPDGAEFEDAQTAGS